MSALAWWLWLLVRQYHMVLNRQQSKQAMMICRMIWWRALWLLIWGQAFLFNLQHQCSRKRWWWKVQALLSQNAAKPTISKSVLMTLCKDKKRSLRHQSRALRLHHFWCVRPKNRLIHRKPKFCQIQRRSKFKKSHRASCNSSSLSLYSTTQAIGVLIMYLNSLDA